MNKNLKNLSYMLLVQVANYLLPLINIPILARVFGPENFGLITYITAIVAYFVLIVDYSFNFTGVRRASKKNVNQEKIFNTICTARIILFFICVILFSIFVYLVEDLKKYYLLMWVFFLSCIIPIFSNMWFLQANNKFKAIAIFNFSSKLIITIGIILLIKTKDDLLRYAIILNFSNLIISLIGFYYIIKKFSIKLQWVNFIEVVNYLKDDRYIFLSSVVTNLYTTTGVVLLGFLSNKTEVGYYGSAQKLIDLAKNLVAIPIYQIIFPILTMKFEESHYLGLTAVKKILPLFNVLVFFVILTLILTGYFSILILFGKEFLPSYTILIILSFGLFAVFYGILIGGQIMLNLGLDKEFVKIQLVVSMLSITLTCIILPFGGSITTAVIWTLSEITITIYQIWVLKNKNIVVFDRNQLKWDCIKDSLRFVIKR